MTSVWMEGTWDKISIVSKINDLIKLSFGHKLMDSKQ